MKNKEKVTKFYMAPYHLEWRLLLKTGDALIEVHFQGGTMGGNGILGAVYKTDNAAIQHLIEESKEFQTGEITLLNRVRPF